MQICSRVLNLPTCMCTVSTLRQKASHKTCILCWIMGLLGDQTWLPGNPVCMWGGDWWDRSAFAQERPACLGGERQTGSERRKKGNPQSTLAKDQIHKLMDIKQAEDLNMLTWNKQPEENLRLEESKDAPFYTGATVCCLHAASFFALGNKRKNLQHKLKCKKWTMLYSKWIILQM